MGPETGKIYQGDCVEIMETWSNDFVVITDPPYGINLDTGYADRKRGVKCGSNNYAPIYGDNKPFDPAHLLRFRKKLLFGANHYCSRLSGSPSWIVWDKRAGMAINDQADCEMAWSDFGGPARLFTHLWNGMLKDSERDERRVHPTQKPVKLFQWIIDKYTQPSDVILDPYCGSGSCLVAAQLCERKWIGIEIEPSYVKIAQERIDAEMAQGKLF